MSTLKLYIAIFLTTAITVGSTIFLTPLLGNQIALEPYMIAGSYGIGALTGIVLSVLAAACLRQSKR